jgi:hypothetical protein
VIIDYASENPSSRREARLGIRGMIFKYALNKEGWEEDLPGLDLLGNDRRLSYSYHQPSTTNSEYFTEFLRVSQNVGGAIEGPSLDVLFQEFRPPTKEDLVEHVKGFGTPRPDGEKVSQHELTQVMMSLNNVEEGFPLLSGWLDPDNLAKIHVPANTSPGIRWRKLGYHTKKDALLPAVLEARRKLTTMIDTGGKYSIPPAGVAGRGKRVDTREEKNEKKEGRLIIMPDLVRHLMGQLGARPYMAALHNVNKENGGVLLGMGPFSEAYQNVANWAKGAKFYCFLDFKAFDQSIGAKLLGAAMGHIRTRYHTEPGSKAYWSSEFEHLVRTEIALPDGSVYKKKRGVASGDPWTSLADSYANWIAIKTVCNRLGWDARIWTFGDDSIIAVYEGRQIPMSTLKEEFFNTWGLTLSDMKSYYSRNLVDIDDNPTPKRSGSFLSMYFLQTPMGVRPTRPLDDLYELMLVPEKNKGNIEWELWRTVSAYLIFYYNEDARIILEEYWAYLHDAFNIPELRPNYTIFQILKEHDIPWERFDFAWLARLPYPHEVELLYKYGHTTFFAPAAYGTIYRDLKSLGFASNRILDRGSDLPLEIEQ